ncbi:Myocilin [Bagarius yarrelli]|uniref:Myocilin n=1 Tax=Bagarius yarrelli TaxID=175774 RepID=A0A556TT03_BAGYA|nr:Myocilin [Bagarius yarrelli]
MQFLVVMWISSLLVGTQAQSTASFSRGNDRNKRCQYTFMVDSPTEASCPATASSAEIEALKSRLGLVEALISRLAGGEATDTEAQTGLRTAYTQVIGDRDRLQQENTRLGQQVKQLQQTVEELQREAERLRSRPCPQQSSQSVPLYDSSRQTGTDPSWSYGSPAYQELKAEVAEFPAPRTENTESIRGCGELLWVGEPVTHRKADSIAGRYGVWMQDSAEATGPYGPNMVWRIDTVGTEVRQLYGYEDMDQLSRGFPAKVLLLPEAVESTGAAMYRGSLYYQRRRSRTLIRYELGSESIAARRDLPHAGFHGQFPYSWGGYTDIDFAVDENGLWVIYSTNKAKGAIVVSQLDPHSLEVMNSWETNIRKATVANAFMICGRLYTVASYGSPNTTVNYTFDTATSQSKAIAVPFQNRHRYNSMIDYNPAQKKLFAWDNYHMVSYDIRLGKQQ